MSNIILLLNKDFSLLVLIANVIAWPVGYYVMYRWLQDFDLEVEYGPAKVVAQIRASEETGSFGWMLWSASNVYTEGAFR